MSSALTQLTPLLRSRIARLPFYYGWVNLAFAALAMTATLPGRTHGLGLIARPLTEDATLGVNELLFTTYNFWAILLGSALCLPIGWLIDRWGVRTVLLLVAAALGGSVVWMSQAPNGLVLFISLVLVRGFGQGSLSVVSMAMIGKWFTRRLSIAMGLFTVLLAIGFIASTIALGEAVKLQGWRDPWYALGLCLLLGLAPFGWLFVRSSPEAVGVTVERTEVVEQTVSEFTLIQALRTPAFWAFTLSMALFNLTWSAITLLNESILAAQGFSKDTFILVMAVLVFSGLPSNLLAGWLATRWPMGRLLAIGMLLLGGSLAFFPWLRTTPQVIVYAAILGAAGGIITVLFFSVYGHFYGRRHLGAIQATVQIISVFASAAGPWLLSSCRNSTGSHVLMFLIAAASALVFAAAVWFVPVPTRSHKRPCG